MIGVRDRGSEKVLCCDGSGACFRSAEQRLKLDRRSVAAMKGGKVHSGKICAFM